MPRRRTSPVHWVSRLRLTSGDLPCLILDPTCSTYSILKPIFPTLLKLNILQGCEHHPAFCEPARRLLRSLGLREERLRVKNSTTLRIEIKNFASTVAIINDLLHDHTPRVILPHFWAAAPRLLPTLDLLLPSICCIFTLVTTLWLTSSPTISQSCQSSILFPTTSTHHTRRKSPPAMASFAIWNSHYNTHHCLNLSLTLQIKTSDILNCYRCQKKQLSAHFTVKAATSALSLFLQISYQLEIKFHLNLSLQIINGLQSENAKWTAPVPPQPLLCPRNVFQEPPGILPLKHTHVRFCIKCKIISCQKTKWLIWISHNQCLRRISALRLIKCQNL